jgi:hypothetical protein
LESGDDDRKTKIVEKWLKKVVLGLKGRKLQRKTVTCTFCRNSEGHNKVRLAGGWVDLCACCKKELETTNQVITTV